MVSSVVRLVVLVVLVVGVPLALAVLVGPPSRLPTELEVRAAFSGAGDEFDRALLYGIAAVVALVWLQIVAAVVWATVARVRHRAPRRPRLVSRALHRLAVNLVSGVTVVSVATTVVTEAPAGSTAVVSDQPVAVAGREHTVGSRQTWWGLAATHLGDGRRWREVAALNPDLGDDIPTESRVTLPGSAYVVAEGDDFWTIARRITRSEDPTVVAEVWVDLVEANRDRLVDPDDPDVIHPGAVVVLPSTQWLEHSPPIEPRSQVADGEALSPEMSEMSAPPVLGVPVGESPEMSVPPVLGVPGAVSSEMSVPPVLDPAGISESGLGAVLTGRFGPGGRLGDAAAGASVTALGVAFHGLVRRRGTSGTGGGPGDEQAGGDGRSETHAGDDACDGGVHPSGGNDEIDDIDRVVAALAVEDPGVEIFGLAIADRITVLLVAPRGHAPAGISVRDDGWSWELGEAALQRFRSTVTGAGREPYVALGDHRTGGRFFVNLARLGHLRLRGSWADVRPFGLAVVTDLVERGVEVAVVDPVGDVLGDRVDHGVTVHPSLAALLDADAHPAGDSCRVVVDLVTDEPESLDRLDFRDGIIAVTANGRAGWVVEVGDGAVRLEPLGVEVTRIDIAGAPVREAEEGTSHQRQSPGGTDGDEREGDGTEGDERERDGTEGDGTEGDERERDGTEGDGTDADETEGDGTEGDERERDGTEGDGTDGDETEELAPGVVGEAVVPAFVAAQRAAEPRGVVEIKILGVVDVVGAAHRFTSPAALDLVTYLAFHREGADADRLKRWVWPPEDPPGDRAFANVLWRARRALGRDADGSDLLPRVGPDRCYRLADDVTTDFAIAEGHIAAAGDSPDDSAIDHLRSALALVRGAPFAGPGFAWSDHVVRAHVEYVMGDAAHRLADLAVEKGDLGVARWAVHQGQLVMPGCEDCYRRRLLIADAAGRPSELRATMAELQRVAESEGDVVAPDLVELYRDLRHSGVA
ncbi:MAG: LysM peptidoglycan-binding domain-containing protein [Acidimicrobiales bacterium]